MFTGKMVRNINMKKEKRVENNTKGNRNMGFFEEQNIRKYCTKECFVKLICDSKLNIENKVIGNVREKVKQSEEMHEENQECAAFFNNKVCDMKDNLNGFPVKLDFAEEDKITSRKKLGMNISTKNEEKVKDHSKYSINKVFSQEQILRKYCINECFVKLIRDTKLSKQIDNETIRRDHVKETIEENIEVKTKSQECSKTCDKMNIPSLVDIKIGFPDNDKITSRYKVNLDRNVEDKHNAKEKINAKFCEEEIMKKYCIKECFITLTRETELKKEMKYDTAITIKENMEMHVDYEERKKEMKYDTAITNEENEEMHIDYEELINHFMGEISEEELDTSFIIPVQVELVDEDEVLSGHLFQTNNQSLYHEGENFKVGEKLSEKNNNENKHAETMDKEVWTNESEMNIAQNITLFDIHKLEYLEKYYENIKYPTANEITKLCIHLGQTRQYVKDWFKRRRRKDKNGHQKKHETKQTYQKLAVIYERNKVLEQYFRNIQFPTTDEYTELQQQLGVSRRSLHAWFYKRRCKDGIVLPNESEMNIAQNITLFDIHKQEYLEQYYENIKYPTANEITKLCKHLGQTRWCIIRWFQKRRHKDKNGHQNKHEVKPYQKRAVIYERKKVLEQYFKNIQFPTTGEYIELQQKLGISRRSLREWFNKRRHKAGIGTSAEMDTFITEYLEEFYEGNKFPNSEDYKHLEDHLGVTYLYLKEWFQNRRLKEENDIKKNFQNCSANDEVTPLMEVTYNDIF